MTTTPSVSAVLANEHPNVISANARLKTVANDIVERTLPRALAKCRRLEHSIPTEREIADVAEILKPGVGLSALSSTLERQQMATVIMMLGESIH